MRASFIHFADIHLGYEQYGVRERFNDFSHSFWNITQEAVLRNVDFVVIAGDLFNKRAIDAQTLIHAIKGLGELKERKIPVIAIEGNHDRSYYREGTSWLQFLCYQGYLTLLSPLIKDGSPVLAPWQKGNMVGAYIDLMAGRLRIYGLPWLGAATAGALEGMAQALAEGRSAEEAEGVEYRLLMMHTGIDGMVARMQGLPTRAQFQTLHPYINYLALGHVHRPYEFDNWIYNPGSTETCSAEEAQWTERGYYYVEIDTDHPEGMIEPAQKECLHHAEHVISLRRPFLRYDLHVDGLHKPEAIYARLEDYCRCESPGYQGTTFRPLVQIHLVGTLGFDPGSLDQSHMEEVVRRAFQPLYVRIDNHTKDQDYVPDDGDIDGRDRSVWHELERHIFEELLGLDNRYLPAKEQWSAILSQIKEQALRKEDPMQIAQFLRERRAALLGS
jgi:DNA repair exonuclease SbcCD nuclease subunit